MLPPWHITSRVARLGEFSLIGRLFPLGTFLNITEVAQTFWDTFSKVEVMFYFCAKMGNILGEFFKNHLVTLMPRPSALFQPGLFILDTTRLVIDCIHRAKILLRHCGRQKLQPILGLSGAG
jgi:hypothetical protein